MHHSPLSLVNFNYKSHKESWQLCPQCPSFSTEDLWLVVSSCPMLPQYSRVRIGHFWGQRGKQGLVLNTQVDKLHRQARLGLVHYRTRTELSLYYPFYLSCEPLDPLWIQISGSDSLSGCMWACWGLERSTKTSPGDSRGQIGQWAFRLCDLFWWSSSPKTQH